MMHSKKDTPRNALHCIAWGNTMPQTFSGFFEAVAYNNFFN